MHSNYNLPKLLCPLTILLFSFCVLGCANDKRNTIQAPFDYKTVTDELVQDTDKARKLSLQATEAYDNGDFEQAFALLHQALSADVMYGPAHNNLGRLYFLQGQHYRAAWEFQYAADLMPDHPGPKSNLGMVYEAVGKIDDAISQYETAYQLAPDNHIMLGNLVRARVRRGDRSPELIELISELALKDPRPQWQNWAHEQLIKNKSHGDYGL